jgi:hypothetical protein
MQAYLAVWGIANHVQYNPTPANASNHSGAKVS